MKCQDGIRGVGGGGSRICHTGIDCTVNDSPSMAQLVRFARGGRRDSAANCVDLPLL